MTDASPLISLSLTLLTHSLSFYISFSLSIYLAVYLNILSLTLSLSLALALALALSLVYRTRLEKWRSILPPKKNYVQNYGGGRERGRGRERLTERENEKYVYFCTYILYI